jgi:hypothetical protein
VAIGAFQQIEDGLALLSRYREAAVSEQAQVNASQRSLDLAWSAIARGWQATWRS